MHTNASKLHAPIHAVELDGASAGSAAPSRWTTAASRSSRARPSPSWARTAPARQPRSRSCSACSPRPAGGHDPRPRARTAVRAGRVGAMLQSGGLPEGARSASSSTSRGRSPRPVAARAILPAPASSRSPAAASRPSPGARRSGCASRWRSPATRTSCSSTSRPSRWMSRAAGRSGTTCGAPRPRAGRSCSRPTISMRPTRPPTGSSSSITGASSPTARRPPSGVGRERTVRFVLAATRRPSSARLAELPAVEVVTRHGTTIALTTRDADGPSAPSSRGGRVRDLEVAGADMDAAFLALTVRPIHRGRRHDGGPTRRNPCSPVP